jgi:hypothetical protein
MNFSPIRKPVTWLVASLLVSIRYMVPPPIWSTPHVNTLNGLLMETSSICSWPVRPPGITANCVFNYLTTLFAASITCVLNCSHTKSTGFHMRPPGHFAHTLSSHSFNHFHSSVLWHEKNKIFFWILSLGIIFHLNMNNGGNVVPSAQQCNVFPHGRKF